MSEADWYVWLWGHNQRAISFALRFCIGTLEPISGLVQLEQLYLYDCRNLTGTICCSGTTSELTHWWNRGSSSTSESKSIDGLEPRWMRGAYWCVSLKLGCGEATRELTHRLISRDTSSLGGAEPISEAGPLCLVRTSRVSHRNRGL